MNIAEIQLTYTTSGSDKPVINSPETAYELSFSIWPHGTMELHEMFVVVLLNASKKALGWYKVSSGGICSTVVDVPKVFQPALLGNAYSILVLHNHPSGNLRPSRSDIRLTERLSEAGKILGIPLDDHLILTSYDYYSFNEEGYLPD